MFNCTQCEKSYAYKSSLTRHMKQKHVHSLPLLPDILTNPNHCCHISSKLNAKVLCFGCGLGMCIDCVNPVENVFFCCACIEKCIQLGVPEKPCTFNSR